MEGIINIKNSLIEFETQVNLYEEFGSQLQADYCQKLEVDCWDLVCYFKLKKLNAEQKEIIEELAVQLRAIGSKYIQILIKNTEKYIDQVRQTQQSTRIIENIL